MMSPLRTGISLRNLGLAILAIVAASCSDSAPNPSGLKGEDGSGEPPSPLNVSNTVLATGAASMSAANSANGGRASLSYASVDANVTYISLQPQTYPVGATATISNQRSGATVTTTMVEGGVDPVPLTAIAGDSVSIAIKTTDGLTLANLRSVVPSRRPPKVVRTVPGRGKTGVPLNKNIEVVFTEPVAPGSLSSIHLFHGSTEVPGTATILQGVTAAVVFQPAANLTANTDYELVLPNNVRDLDGDGLDSTARVSFSTGTSIEGPVASLNLVPEGANIRIGEQFQASVVAKDAGGNVITGHPVTWLADTLHLVAVTSTGLVTGQHEGLGTVLAEVDGVLAQMPVQVSNALHQVTSVVVAFDSGGVAPGGTLQVAAIALDGEGNLEARRLVEWSSTNSAVATVAASQPAQSETNPAWFKGFAAPASAIYWASVTGVANGVASIVVTIEGHSDTVAVTVGSALPVVGLTLSRDTATVLLNEKVPFTGSSVNSAGGRAAIPATQIQWESSNPGVASVDANGVVAGVSAGAAIITGHWNSYSASTRVSVVQLTFESVSTGGAHTCALATGGATYCWGGNDAGQSGQPGLFDPELPVAAVYPKPVPVAPGLIFVAITAGEKHTCGLTAAGAAYCWGSNFNSALGSGTAEDSWRPVPVSGGVAFASIAAGYEHTCGLTAAGAAYCWGAGYDGQLGNGATTSSAVPVAVRGGIAFAQLTAGRDHTCGLAGNGLAYCWGGNWNAQLGVGPTVSSTATPLPVIGGMSFASISAGEAHTCGVTRSGSLYCWGANYDAQLGTGDLRDVNEPVPVASNLSFSAVGGGFVHTCAIDAGGSAYCWGVNDAAYLELGNLSPGTYTTPQRVVGGLAFDRLTVRRSHSCARTTGAVWYCWGENDSGELGVGSTTSGGTPLKVLGQQ
jgi:alpha-tubulin suppressor-like RCC1 family protein